MNGYSYHALFALATDDAKPLKSVKEQFKVQEGQFMYENNISRTEAIKIRVYANALRQAIFCIQVMI